MSAGAFSVDDDLDVTWARVVQEFEKEAQIKFVHKQKLTIDDVLVAINPKDVTPDTKTKAKAVVQQVLVCVQRFGDVVASATSTVFGPSQQCFNALNFVIVATQNYSKVFEDLTILMERISVFFETLRIYIDESGVETKLDKRLRPNVYRVLEHFMTILTLATRLTTRKGKVKLFAKVFFFGEDSGVTEALATLETRVSDVVRIQVAVIGKDLSGAARDIRAMKGDMDLMLEYDKINAGMLTNLNDNESVRRSDETIRSWLHLDHINSWPDPHGRISEDRATGTGSWLFTEDQDFVRWCNLDTEAPSTVLVTGEARRGKTFLASAVVEYLRKTLTTTNSTSISAVAHYYSQPDAVGGSDLSPINQALRSIVWQFAKTDLSFYDFVLKACQDSVSIHNSDQIWDSLFASYNPASDTAFFLVIDGIEDGAVENLKKMMVRFLQTKMRRSQNRLQIRLFITATPQAARVDDSIGQVHEVALGTGLEHGKLVANIDDVQRLIKARLLSLPIFRDDISLSKRQQQQRVLESMSRHIQNDFSRLDLVFRELEHCVNLRQLEEILEQINEPIDAKIRRQVEILNQTLSQDEILEVNAIITCISSFVPSGCDADIRLVEQFVDMELKATRLVSLKGQIEDRYHSLFAVNAKGVVSWRYSGLKTYLVESFEDEQTINKIHAKRGTRSVGLDLEELDLLEKIVHTNFTNVFGAHGSALFDKYGFADFFGSKRGQHKATISFDEKQSQVLALYIGLKVLCEDLDTARTGYLRDSAQSNLNELVENAAAEQATEEHAQAIGRCLVKLLRNDQLIDEWSQNTVWRKSLICCFQSSVEGSTRSSMDGEAESSVSTWLSVTGLANALHDRAEKVWLCSLQGNFWDHVINRLVRRWVQQGIEDQGIVLSFRANAKWYNDDIDNEHKWLCQQCPDIDWATKTRLLVEKYGSMSSNGLRRSQQAWVVDTCNTVNEQNTEWWALFFSAKHLFNRKWSRLENTKRAHDQLELAASMELFHDKDYTNYYWKRMLPLLADCKVTLGNMAGARDTYLHIMEHSRGQGSFELPSLGCLEPVFILDILKTAERTTVSETNDLSWLHKLATGLSKLDDAFAFRITAHQDGNRKEVIRCLESVLRTMTDEQGSPKQVSQKRPKPEQSKVSDKTALKVVKSVLAHILWYGTDESGTRDRALDLWHQAEDRQAMTKALLEQAETEMSSEPMTSAAFSRLQKLLPGICNHDEAQSISVEISLMIARWKYASGETQIARTLGLELIQEYSTSLSSWTRNKEMEAWGLLCLALNNDDLARAVFEQMREHEMVNQDGSETSSGGRDPPGVPKDVFYCKTCFTVVSSETHSALKQGLLIPGFCGKHHEHLLVRAFKDDKPFVWDWDPSAMMQYSIWRPNQMPLELAKAIYVPDTGDEHRTAAEQPASDKEDLAITAKDESNA